VVERTFLPLTVLLTSLPSTVTSFVSIPSLTSTVVVCSLPFTILDVVVTETEDDRRDRGDPVGDPIGTFLPLTVLLTSLPSTVTSFVSIPSLTSTLVVWFLPFTLVVDTETEDDRRDRGDPVGDPVVSDWRPRGQGVVVVVEEI